MIYLLITLAGFGLLIMGLYLMTFGFGIPPDFGLFLLGLCMFVAGMLMLVLFAGKIDLQSLKIETTPKPARRPRKGIMEKIKAEIKPKEVPAESATKTEKTPTEMKPVPKPMKKPRKDIMEKIKAEIKPKEVPAESATKTEKTPTEMKPVPKPMKKPRKDIMEKIKAKEEKPEKPKEVPAESTAKGKVEEVPSKASLEAAGRSADKTPRKPAPQKDKKAKDSSFVKERLHSLKREYMEDVKGVDEIIEDRLSPFKGVLDRIKSESKSSIIWSFDASDVQDAMRDILKKANESIIIMYPWIRNLDVSILKKFMDTKSRIIIQEASLDDEASVELIKLLLNNNVDIRTMPHIHTVAAVADNNKGLIISTDPIYDSFEVGVIYNDRKSVKEIEKLFEKAWSLSERISLGG